MTSIDELVQALAEAWNNHAVDDALRYYAADYVGSDVAQAPLLHGLDALRQSWQGYFHAFPDAEFKVESVIVQGNRVALAWVAHGTHHGVFMHIPPTGRAVQVRGVALLTLRDGKVCAGQVIWDVAGLLRHMGLLPEL